MTSKEKSTGYTEVFSWGSDHAGQMGLAGKKPGRTYITPRFCSFNVVIHSISCGDEHSAFIASNGYIYTMGSNADGRLGISSRNVKSTASPCLVEVLSRYKAIKVSCGFGHTAAVVETGELFTWGLGQDGQLGIGSINDHHSPQLVTYLNPNTGKTLPVITVDVDCGARHTAAVTDNGELYMFGSSDYGQLGTGKTDKETFPVKIDLYSKVVSAASGIKHTLILTEHGKVYACGGNSSGELGTGNKRSSLIFTKVAFVNDTNIKKVGAGSHSAAVSESGELYIWGTGTFGEFLQPQKMSGIKTPITDVSLGNGFGCAIDIGGQILTWGTNKNGELGLGDSDPRLVPTPVTSLQGKRVTYVSCGGTFSMSLGITILQKNEDSLTRSRFPDDPENSISRKEVGRNEYEMKRNQSYEKFERDGPRSRGGDEPKKSITPRAIDNDYQNYRTDFQRFGGNESRPTFGDRPSEFRDKSPDIKRPLEKSPKTPHDTNYPTRRNYDEYSHSPLQRNPSYSRYDLTREKMEQAIVNVSFEAEKDMFKAQRDLKSKNVTPVQESQPRFNSKEQFANDSRIRPFIEEPKKIYEETRDLDHEGLRSKENFRERSANRTPRDVDYHADESRLAKENRILKDTISDLKLQLMRAEKAQFESDEIRKSAIEKRYEKLERDYTELDRRYLDLERSAQVDKEALKRAFEEENAQKDRFNKISIDNQKLISNLENENKRANEKIQKINEELIESEKERDFLRRKVDELQRKNDRQSSEFNEALKQREDDIERVIQEKRDLQQTLDELNSSLRKYGKDSAFDRETIERLKDDRQKDAKHIDNLKYEIETYKIKLSGLERAKDEIMRDYEDKIKSLKDEGHATNDEIRVLKGEISLRNAEVEETSLRLKHVEKLYEDKKIEIKELRSLISTLESSIQTKNQEIKYLKNTIEELQYKSSKIRFEEIDASRISPNKSLNLNETNDFSKAEDLSTILKKDPRYNNPNHRAISTNPKQRTGGYEQNKTRDTLHFSEHESLWFNSKKSALHEDDLKHSPYKKKESPMAKPSYHNSPEKDVREFDDRKQSVISVTETATSRRYREHTERLETSAAQAKMQEIGDAANKLMDLLNLDKNVERDHRFEMDKSNKVMETIREENSASAERSNKPDLHYTAKFSQRENSFNTTDRHYDLKTLEAVEIPLDGNQDEGSPTHDMFNRRGKFIEEVKTPDEKTNEKTNLKDLKVKLQDLQKNKIALEQRMQDFEKRLQDSKKKPQ